MRVWRAKEAKVCLVGETKVARVATGAGYEPLVLPAPYRLPRAEFAHTVSLVDQGKPEHILLIKALLINRPLFTASPEVRIAARPGCRGANLITARVHRSSHNRNYAAIGIRSKRIEQEDRGLRLQADVERSSRYYAQTPAGSV
jgi:hypothetical protein